MADTRECPNCEATVGTSESKCPACGIDFAEFEDAMTATENINKAIERKRKKETPPDPPPVAQPKTNRLGRLASLGSVLRKEKK